MISKRVISLIFGVAIFGVQAAQDAVATEKALDYDTQGLLSLSLEDLSNLKVTSVSSRAERYVEAPAAVYVITKEDIKRSGLTSIPEILRMAPGVQVTRVGSSKWSISARGFNSQFANKLLVLIDGRSVYTPVYSGVYWDVQDTLIEDINRIEVIRGPGATVWGANAVNGVINIITEDVDNSMGTYVDAGYGNIERGFVDVRQGVKLNDTTGLRVYGKSFKRAGFSNLSGSRVPDDWDFYQAGFRAENKPKSGKSKLSVHGDIYTGSEEGRVTVPTTAANTFIMRDDSEEVVGGNVLAKWDYDINDWSTTSLQGYYDLVKRDGFPTGTHDIRTVDLDFKHFIKEYKGHEVTWGLGFRNIDAKFYNTNILAYNPSHRSVDLYTTFIQDKIALNPDKLYLTLGSKFEMNDYTGYEYQPSARLTWLKNFNETIWAAVSRAVRTPHLFQDDGFLAVNGNGSNFIALVGNRYHTSEEMVAYEVGYKVQPRRDLALDFSLFYNDYSKLTTNKVLSATSVSVGNDGVGESYGFELGYNYDISSDWELSGGYNFLKVNLDDGLNTGVNSETRNPKNQFNVRSNYKLPYNVELSNSLYYTDEIVIANIDSYVRFDTGLIWHAMDGVEMSLFGQNLFDDLHQEFDNNINEIDYQVPRSFVFKTKVTF